MTSEQPSERQSGTDKSREAKSEMRQRPDWANGLRQLYESVVDEELPDTFKDLLSQLDAKD